MKIFLKDSDATDDLGKKISKLISSSNNNVIEIHLIGELGAGKTFLTKSILNALGWHGVVKSPTYTYVMSMKLKTYCFYMLIYIGLIMSMMYKF